MMPYLNKSRESGDLWSAAEEDTFALDGKDYVVAPKCDQDEGRWICTTHGEIFRNQWEKDGHIHAGDHVLAWMCFHHGPEVP